jgi:hypothetical protein
VRKQHRLHRKVAIKDQKQKLYIFSEGQNTEPLYFEAYGRLVASTIVQVVCLEEHGSPRTLLKHAREKRLEISRKNYRRDNGEFDKVWIVFDQDDHPGIPDVLAESMQQSINVAFSVPCFEVWLILHEEDYDRDEHRHKTQSKCEEVCLGYSKATRKVPNLGDLMKKVADAEKRAKALFERREADGGLAPKTTVFRLVAAIRGESEPEGK